MGKKIQEGARHVGVEEAAAMLSSFIQETDADTLAAMFEHTFGYKVMDSEEKPGAELVCTPGPECGFALEDRNCLLGKTALLPDGEEGVVENVQGSGLETTLFVKTRRGSLLEIKGSTVEILTALE